MFYIYILYSPEADRYYVGHTEDIERRLIEHQAISENSFTSKHRPWQLVTALDAGHDRGEAMQIERFIKRQKSRRFIEYLFDRHSVDFIRQKIFGS